MIVEEIDHFVGSAFYYLLTKYLTNTFSVRFGLFICGLFEVICVILRTEFAQCLHFLDILLLITICSSVFINLVDFREVDITWLIQVKLRLVNRMI